MGKMERVGKIGKMGCLGKMDRTGSLGCLGKKCNVEQDGSNG